MRVIFLDFDGVLHPLGLVLQEGRTIRGKAVARPTSISLFCWLPLLARLLAAHDDVRLVVHSSWRSAHSEQQLRTFLGPLADRFVGATDDVLSKAPSIGAWLQDHPAVVSYCVLDDALQESDGAQLVGSLIRCDSGLGLSEATVQAQLRAWLEATSS